MKKASYKLIELLCYLGFCIPLIYIQLYRVINWTLDIDEGITYTRYVFPYFRPGKNVFIATYNFFRHLDITYGAAANNHILNSLMIGFCSLVTGKEFDERVIRMPAFGFLSLLIIVIAIGIFRERLRLVAGIMLLSGSTTFNFAIQARGYCLVAFFVLVDTRKKCQQLCVMTHKLLAIICR